MPGVCLVLREIYAISSRPRIISLDHRPQAPSATYRRKGLDYGATEVPTSLDANDVVQPKARVCPGKQLVVADLLSRKPLRESIEAITLQQEEDVSLHVIRRVNNWPASPGKLGQIRRATTEDEELQMAIQFTQHGWPKYA